MLSLTTVASIFTAGAAIGTANAFFAAFLCLDDVGDRAAKDQGNDGNRYDIG